MKKVLISLTLVGFCLAAASAWADILETKDGQLVEGKYLGGTQHSIRFQIDKQIKVFPVQDVLALTFSASSGATSSSKVPPAKKPESSSQAVTPAPKPNMNGEIVLQPGTKVAVRMLESLYLENSRKDDWFRGSLESDVIVDGVTVLPKGAQVNGQVVTSEQGKRGSTLAITLREVVVGEQVIPLATSNYMVQDQATQNVLDFGISSLKIVKRDRRLQIPHRSILEFETQEPVKFRRAK